jgi:hypothetical protein
MLYFVLKTVHVIGAAVLLGTGAGIAFFMLVAHLRGDPHEIAGVARTVVLADFLFTASAVVLQPVTGVWLAWSTGHSLLDGSRCRSRSTSSPEHSGCRWSSCRYACATWPSQPSPRACRCLCSIIASSGGGSRSVFRPSPRYSASSG